MPLSSIVSGSLSVHVREVIAADGNVDGEELLSLCAIVKGLGLKSVFEIGTFDGRTTLNFAASVPYDGRVVTLDLPASDVDKTKFDVEPSDRVFIDKPGSGARFQGTPEAARIEQVYGDSATFDFRPYEGQFDFVFVDGSHAYDYARADSVAAMRLLRNGRGVIVWHDYGSQYWPGVTKALDELAETPDFKGLAVIGDTRLAFISV